MILQKDDRSGWNAWQAFLVTQGFTGLVCDGVPGPATERATRSFQLVNHLAGDGIVGDATLAAAKAKGFGGLDCGQTDTPLITTKPIVEPGLFHVAAFDLDKNDAINATFYAGVAPKLQVLGKAFEAAAAKDGAHLRIVQGIRSFEYQHSLYLQTNPRVTHADAGQSNHNYGLALDYAVLDVDGKIAMKNGDWDASLYPPFHKWAAEAGLAWGGDWHGKDMPHIELPGIPKWQVLLGWYQHGGIAEVWRHF